MESRAPTDQIWTIEILKILCESRGNEGLGFVTESDIERIDPVLNLVLGLRHLNPSGDWSSPSFLADATGWLLPATYSTLLRLIDRYERQASPYAKDGR